MNTHQFSKQVTSFELPTKWNTSQKVLSENYTNKFIPIKKLVQWVHSFATLMMQTTGEHRERSTNLKLSNYTFNKNSYDFYIQRWIYNGFNTKQVGEGFSSVPSTINRNNSTEINYFYWLKMSAQCFTPLIPPTQEGLNWYLLFQVEGTFVLKMGDYQFKPNS